MRSEGTYVIPAWTLRSSPAVASRADLAATSRTQSKMTAAAFDALVPIPYGSPRVPGLLANAMTYGNKWLFWVIWGEGPLTSFIDVTMNDLALPAGATIANYLGTTAGQLDATLVAAFAAQSPTVAYAELLPGLAYSVIRIPYDQITSTPRFDARVNGRKVYDPRTAQTYGDPSTYAWSNNPALCLADFLENTTWGAGKTVTWSTVTTVANFNDTLLGTAPNTEKQRLIDLLLDREATVEQWVETLRTAAACFVVENQGVIKLVADKDETPGATYDHAAGQIIGIANPEMRSPETLPTVMVVTHTDASKLPWTDATTDPVALTGVGTTLPYRKSAVDMRWITRPSQATREAIERINKLRLRGIVFQLQLFDEGLRHEPGDVIAVTYPDAGFNALPVRVLNATPNNLGWMLTVEKHDPGAYSTTVQSGTGTPNTDLPLPSNPPAMGALTLTEVATQVQTGYFASSVRVSWSAVEWPFLLNYAIVVTQSGVVKDSGMVGKTDTSWASKSLAENLPYVVSVSVLSSTGISGAAATGNITLDGKLTKPSDVQTLTAIEIGGEVRLNWTAATDLDLTGYEVRYGAPGVTWANAAVLDRVAAPALRYETRSVPAGTVDVLIKALDSVRSATYPFGQESVNEARASVTVTLDSGMFIAASGSFSTATLHNMSYQGGAWVTDFGQTWGALFPNAMSTYGKPVASYHTSGTSALWTNIVDIGATVTGDFIGTITYTDVYPADGTATKALQLSGGGEATKTITGATNASPIVMQTSGAHGYSSNDEVVQAGVLGNTAANGRFKITYVDSTHYSLQTLGGVDVAGNGAWSAGGTQTASRWVWTDLATLTGRATARYIRIKISTTTTGTLSVTSLGTYRATVVTLQERGIITLTDTTGNPTTDVVTLSGHYIRAASIQLSMSGNVAANGYAVYDAVAVDAVNPNTFKVYGFNAAGARLGGDVSWTFEGV